MTALLAVSFVVLSGCGEATPSSDSGLTSTTSVPAPTTSVVAPITIDRVSVMARVEELFGSGDLLGVEVSIDSITNEIVIYSDELTLSQKERIEETLGDVTYYRDIRGGGPPEPGVTDDTFPENPSIRIGYVQISVDRQTVTLAFVGMCDPLAFKGWARVNGDVLEVAVTHLGYFRRCPLIERGLEVTVVLEEPFNGTKIQDLATGSDVRVLEQPDA
jgi:hypothetical protein